MPRFLLLVCALIGLPLDAADRPNILWITSEDNSPWLGCYGEPLAQTPNLDRLAVQGVRYRRAFANAPVCSTARTTLITGLHACATGLQHHRSRVPYPADHLMYPEHLRAAGYHCTNNSKEDYNFAGKRKVWDASSRKAHYRDRQPGQPFFAVFNLTSSHESQVAPKPGKSSFRIAPEAIPLPPYHPDTPELRRDWANYHDQMTLMDAEAGALLDELERLGEADNTIVFYFGDHGGALPRGKRNLHDSGTRVPLIVRIPERWQHWRPAEPGGWVEDLVSFVDLPATVLSLCGVNPPATYQGQPFLGDHRSPAREHVFLFRGRMDERYDTARALRDRDFRYIRNYSPHRPWGQHYCYAFKVQPGMRSWFAAFEAGRCNPVQAAYWLPKPAEEFYDLRNDPHEIRNLAADPAQADHLARLRAELRREMLAIRDTGFIPEGMFPRLAGDGTIREYALSDAYPLARVIDLADLACSRDPAALGKLAAALTDPQPLLRYWAATGCLVLGEAAQPARAALQPLLQDDTPDVRVVAAEALARLGDTEPAFETLAGVLQTGNLHEALAAQNAIEALWRDGRLERTQAQKLLNARTLPEPGDRIPALLRGETP